jgi:WD40 repeat protein
MTEVSLPIIRITTPSRAFEDHQDSVLALAFLPDGRRMVTCSYDKTLRLWDMRDKVVLEKMEGHCGWVRAVAVSGDGQLIASGDTNGELMVWHGDSGDCLMQAVKVHSKQICSIAFSPDGTVLATGSWDKTTELWCTRTWQVQGNPIYCGDEINCIRYSPSGELLAIATDKDIQMWNPYTRERVANFEAHAAIKSAWNFSLTWTPDGTRLLSAGSTADPTIREWNTSTWQQVGDPWSGHADYISSIAVNSTATLVVTASLDNQVRLWRLSDQRTIAIFKDSDEVYCVNFSTNSKHILSAGANKMIMEWAIPEDALLEDTPKEQVSSP